MLTCALTLLAGLAQAQQPAPAEAPAAMPATGALGTGMVVASATACSAGDRKSVV